MKKITVAEIKQRAEHIIKGHKVFQSLITLSKVEQRLNAFRGQVPKEGFFRIIDNWLINEKILWDQLLHPFSQSSFSSIKTIPGFPVQKFFLTLFYLLFSNRIRVRALSNAVSFKNNIRAFYTGRKQLTLWVAIRIWPAEKLPIALKIRKRLSSSPGIRLPMVIEHDITTVPQYILEELIIGRSFGQPGDWDLLMKKLLPSLLNFYDSEGVSHQRVGSLYDVEQISRDISLLIPIFKWKEKGMASSNQLLEATEQFLRFRDEKLPICVGHGDLNKTNLSVDVNGEITLLDCEASRELPLAKELISIVLKVYRPHPEIFNHLALQIQRRTLNPTTMPPKRQFLLVTLEKIAEYSSIGNARKAKKWVRLASALINEPDL